MVHLQSQREQPISHTSTTSRERMNSLTNRESTVENELAQCSKRQSKNLHKQESNNEQSRKKEEINDNSD